MGLAKQLATWSCVAAVLVASGCAHDGRRSVKPGINDAYREANVEEWSGRFESESREIFAHRESIVRDAGIKPGMSVADIGAGTGFMTELMARMVGDEGQVYAVDVTPEFVEHIRERMARANLTNVSTIRCAEDSVDLPAESIDLAFICDTYHHFEYPESTLASIWRALKPGGTMVIIDFERIPGVSRDWILDHVRVGRDEVHAEVVAAGFEIADHQPDARYLKENYFAWFRKPRLGS